MTEMLSLRRQHVERTGLVSKAVSREDSIGMLWVIPFQIDGFQIGLSDS